MSLILYCAEVSPATILGPPPPLSAYPGVLGGRWTACKLVRRHGNGHVGDSGGADGGRSVGDVEGLHRRRSLLLLRALLYRDLRHVTLGPEEEAGQHADDEQTDEDDDCRDGPGADGIRQQRNRRSSSDGYDAFPRFSKRLENFDLIHTQDSVSIVGAAEISKLAENFIRGFDRILHSRRAVRPFHNSNS